MSYRGHCKLELTGSPPLLLGGIEHSALDTTPTPARRIAWDTQQRLQVSHRH